MAKEEERYVNKSAHTLIVLSLTNAALITCKQMTFLSFRLQYGVASGNMLFLEWHCNGNSISNNSCAVKASGCYVVAPEVTETDC